jgi:hypothetical protein
MYYNIHSCHDGGSVQHFNRGSQLFNHSTVDVVLLDFDLGDEQSRYVPLGRAWK